MNDVAIHTAWFFLALILAGAAFTVFFAIVGVVVDGHRRNDAYERDQHYWMRRPR